MYAIRSYYGLDGYVVDGQPQRRSGRHAHVTNVRRQPRLLADHSQVGIYRAPASLGQQANHVDDQVPAVGVAPALVAGRKMLRNNFV